MLPRQNDTIRKCTIQNVIDPFPFSVSAVICLIYGFLVLRLKMLKDHSGGLFTIIEISSFNYIY